MIAMMLAATVLLADAAPAAAPVGNKPTAAPAKDVKVNKDGMICRNERIVGSRMPSKVCMTPQQWEERKANDRQDLERSQRTDLPGHD